MGLIFIRCHFGSSGRIAPSPRRPVARGMAIEDALVLGQELARVGMPNGVADFSFHTLFDPAAGLECGRCNDACPPAGAGLQPRDHSVLASRDPSPDVDGLMELAPPDIVATCTHLLSRTSSFLIITIISIDVGLIFSKLLHFSS